jgi:threonine dehydrogenase-like Zn-dependent dehydrogenase
MLAARAYENESSLRLEEIDPPAPAPGDVVIEVKSAGLAPGVLEQWARGRYPILPRTLGNEAAGIIAEVGAQVSGFEIGDRVRLHPNLCCRQCEYCHTDREQFCAAHSLIGQSLYGPDAMPLHQRYLNGALAEYVVAPAWLVDHLDESVSLDAACKVHDIADALRAWKTTGVGPGATIVLTAATGTIGSSFVRMAPLLGVGRVIAVARSAERLAQIRDLHPGLVDTIATEDLGEGWAEGQKLTAAIRGLVADGPDAVIDFTPEGPTTWQAVASTKRGGSVALMGPNLATPPLPTLAIMVNGWRLNGMRGCTREDARQVLRWLASGQLKVEDLVTHQFTLAEIAAAEKTVRERREPTWMVVIHP